MRNRKECADPCFYICSALTRMAPLDNQAPPLLAPVKTLAFLQSPRRRLVRPPKLPRPHGHPPPSIPVRDQAWGYEEVNGHLILQKPLPLPGSTRGPGAYELATDFTLPIGPAYDFGQSTGREYKDPSSPASQNAEDGQPPRAQTVVPPRQPLPLAAMVLHCRDSRNYVRRELPIGQPPEFVKPRPPPSPGPGTFSSARGIGDLGRVRSFPRQTRYHVRPVVVQPSSARLSGRMADERTTATMLGTTSTSVAPSWSRSPRGRPSFGAISIGRSMTTPTTSARLPPRRCAARHRRMDTQQQLAVEKNATKRPEPKGLDALGKALWRIFCFADDATAGSTSASFTRLSSLGASLSGEYAASAGSTDNAERLETYREADQKRDGFMSWDEFWPSGSSTHRSPTSTSMGSQHDIFNPELQ